MGGASTQITFVRGADSDGGATPTDSVDLKLYRHSIELYSHSYLCFGVDRASRRRQALLLNASNCAAGEVVTDPCLPVGANTTLSEKRPAVYARRAHALAAPRPRSRRSEPTLSLHRIAWLRAA